MSKDEQKQAKVSSEPAPSPTKTVDAWGEAKGLLPAAEKRIGRNGVAFVIHNESHWKLRAAVTGMRATGKWLDPLTPVTEAEFDAAVRKFTDEATHR